ncbi:D-aminoacyl-tRNA deacylase 1-like isoform X2 [Vespa mandarinia]|uniref:D-aminoacyl-tRNA deacylase 1-like isoform X2 n=1 Tax=Vespa mandarinia TaxID=7446 RepID=UPI00160EEB59|nr:D-aminoacyl-tRNA deacylase 1-like isoform X2 [Vespa mandarinia]
MTILIVHKNVSSNHIYMYTCILCVYLNVFSFYIICHFVCFYRVRKILNTKVFENDKKKWSASVMDKQYEILCISQFTLYHVLKGNKLDFHRAMPAQESEPFYKIFLNELGKNYKPELIKDGIFGAMMEVSIQNSGPVTLEIESPIKPIEDSTKISEKQ